MIKRIWHFLNMPCEEVSHLVSEGYDRDLTRAERFAVRSHLVYCKACRRFRRHWDLLRKTLADVAEGPEVPMAGPELSADAKDRIRRAIDQA